MFAAYRVDDGTSTSQAVDQPENPTFLENQSYTSIPVTQATVDGSSCSSDSDSENEAGKSQLPMLRDRPEAPIEPPAMYFYEDRERRKEYLKMESLPARAVPMHNRHKRKINLTGSRPGQKFKRYFKSKKIRALLKDGTERLLDSSKTNEEEMRLYLTRNPHEVDKWIEYVDYQNSIAIGPKEQNAKVKLETIEKALHFNPNDKQLSLLYLDAISSVYSNSEVKKLIEDLIGKDLYNFTLWKYLLRNHQSSMMADGGNTLKLYEKAMNTLKRHQDSDPKIIMLFKSCGLFLRQCGLNEQFFGVIHLMISLNITTSPEIDRLFFANELQDPLLTEYEELVLKSNLPMNELWYRMEVLRSICNFLPVKETSMANMNDPQRYVFNEDICTLVNPLKNNLHYNFDLFIVILKLLKIPMPHYRINNEIFTVDEREIECGMDFLSILMEKTYSSEEFNKIIYIVAKDLNVSPNYTNFNIENEAYFDLISKLLLLSCNSFNDRQNKIVLIIWLKFQRLAVVMDQMKSVVEKNSSLDKTKYRKQIKSRVKSALKNSKYQNDLYVFKEYALIEQALGDVNSCQNILSMAIESAPANRDETDFYSVVLELCEQKLAEGDKIECVEKLRHLSGDNLEVLDYFCQRIDMEKFDENPHEIEEYFLPTSNKLNLIKAKVFYILCQFSKRRALEEILNQIQVCGGILREKLYELFFWIFQLKWSNEVISMKFFMEIAVKALEKYPRNCYILHSIASHKTLRWFDIRKMLLKSPTIESVFYLLIASKHHEDKFFDDENSKIYKHRIYNIIDRVVNNPQVSSILIWRIYLRTAFSFDFSKCKRILYQILDINPMIKQLYIDGARYLPEEHSQLLDLIVEKGLRAHSLAEELEILRTQSV